MLLEEKVHLTDIEFSKYCEDSYRVNRGVYNTIDMWFYEQGETNILERRRKTLMFLSSQARLNEVKFGKGGLSSKLKDFMEQKREKQTD